MRTAMYPAPLLAFTLAAATGASGCSTPAQPEAAPSQSATQTQPNATTDGAHAPSAGPAQALTPSATIPAEPDATGAADLVHTQTLEADPAQSSVGFAVARATVGHVGHFERFSAQLVLVDELPTQLEISVKTGSVVADRKGLTSHLKSPDFFDANQFPSAIFTTDQITAQPQIAPNSFELSGTMRLHGVGRKISFQTTIDVEPDRVVGRAPLEISAKSFGIQYEGMEAELAEDTVQLEIELVFPRPKE